MRMLIQLTLKIRMTMSKAMKAAMNTMTMKMAMSKSMNNNDYDSATGLTYRYMYNLVTGMTGKPIPLFPIEMKSKKKKTRKTPASSNLRTVKPSASPSLPQNSCLPQLSGEAFERYFGPHALPD